MPQNQLSLHVVHSTQPKGCVQAQLVLDAYLSVVKTNHSIQAFLTQYDVENTEHLEELSLLVDVLCGPFDPVPQAPPWLHSQALVKTLYRHSACLEVATGGLNHKIDQWRDLVGKTLVHARHVLNALRASKTKNIVTTIARLVKSIDRLKPLLPQILKPFRNDENVLLFLIKRHQDFEPLGGASYVSELLTMLQPKGLNALRDLVMSRYRARGFDELVETITEKVGELQCQLC